VNIWTDRKIWGRSQSLIINCFALLIGALLFAGSFPNLFFEKGIAFLAWLAYFPVFWLLYRISFRASFFYGALYGYVAYSLFNYWLNAFHPLAGVIVDVIYLFYFFILFPVLKIALVFFPKRGYLIQLLVWVSFEYIRTLGFLGYPYGITGYSQWYILPVIQIASLVGVWGVSTLVLFPSVYLAALFSRENKLKGMHSFLIGEWIPAAIWGICLAGTLIYGFMSPVDYTGAATRRIALVQHNTDPWRGGLVEYRRNFNVLQELSNEALAQNPKPDLIVWSETAFVPRIEWHKQYRTDRESWLLVKDLLDYLALQEVPFVIGNDDASKDLLLSKELDGRVDYNAVMLFNKGEVVDIYRKIHLVPFTEYFPYQKQLPFVYNALIHADTHFWEKGTEVTVFEINGLKFSSPICFEDSFGYLSRNFVRNGAELLVNLSNDAWSNSLSAQMQHFAMAVFRAVENRRSMVRSTASGQTCAIDPNGRVINMAKPFAEIQLTVDVPIVKNVTSFYTRYGDFLPRICIILIILMIPAAIIRYMIKVRNHGKD
jgi:apolipoprotein N-acyltransferase